jgi:hypothetical protein
MGLSLFFFFSFSTALISLSSTPALHIHLLPLQIWVTHE